MPVAFDRVYLHSAGYFMPGEPVDNDAMDQYIAPLNRISGRIKNRILAENGIWQRYYAIDPEGRTRWSNAQLAAQAIQACLARGATSTCHRSRCWPAARRAAIRSCPGSPT